MRGGHDHPAHNAVARPRGQTVGVASLFSVTGPAPSLYQVWFSLLADGAVTDGGLTPIATGTEGAVGDLEDEPRTGVNFVGGAAAGSDALWLRTFDGQWSNWVKASVSDLG